MGYTLSKAAVERVKSVLDEAVKAPPASKLILSTKEPRRLAFALRTAFKSANKYPKTYPEYVGLDERYSILQGNDEIILVPKRAELEVDPIIELAKAGSDLVVEGASNVFEVVGAAIKHKNITEITFPNAILDNAEMVRLYNWTSTNGYAIINTTPLVITKNFNEHTVQWRPQSQTASS